MEGCFVRQYVVWWPGREPTPACTGRGTVPFVSCAPVKQTHGSVGSNSVSEHEKTEPPKRMLCFLVTRTGIEPVLPP